MSLHPLAVIDPRAEVAAGVEVGPFAVVGAGVRLESGVVVGPHAVLEGPTRIGPGTWIAPFAAVGGAPQHKRGQEEAGTLEIGARCTIREYVTLNRGTRSGGGVTRIGDDVLLMAGVHVAHDCQVGSGAVLSNGATLAGHVEIGGGATLGGLCAVQQFSRIGRLAFIAGGARVARDVPPFVRAAGDRACLEGLNRVGLERGGVELPARLALRAAWRALFMEGPTVAEATARLRAAGLHAAEVAELLDFIEGSKRGLCALRRRYDDAADAG